MRQVGGPFAEVGRKRLRRSTPQPSLSQRLPDDVAKLEFGEVKFAKHAISRCIGKTPRLAEDDRDENEAFEHWSVGGTEEYIRRRGSSLTSLINSTGVPGKLLKFGHEGGQPLQWDVFCDSLSNANEANTFGGIDQR